jgi:site-specific recombinase XerD
MSTTSNRTGGLLEHKAGYYARLIELGYSISAAKKQRQLLVDFACWTQRRRIPLADLAGADTEAFFRRRRAQGKANLRTPLSLDPLFAYLRQIGALAAPAPCAPTGPLEVFLAGYLSFLTAERGLAQGTARMYLRMAGQLASEHEGDNRIDWAALRAGDVTDFTRRACQGQGVSWARQVVSAVRCLLRYLQLEGLTDLALDQAEVEALLGSCDRQSAIGRRDYAILLLLCRLGLRGGEVIGLMLDDIGWRSGEIVVKGKGGRRDRLPLPADVGEALADYVCHGRPRTDDRAVFVRHCAPIRRIGETGTIRSVLARACERAGLAYVRPHRLRHTVATEMLRAGVPLRDIGQVLGHQSAAATAVYTRVDLDSLRTVARHWPEAAA